jgi:protein-S-isoprenylcysteine O-methyltransferase Ste14
VTRDTEAGGERDPAGERDAAGVIAPPPLIYLAALAIGFGLTALLPDAALPDAVGLAAGIPLVLAGIGLAASFIASFRRARTAVDPYRPTTAIVTSGPYRFTRNPGYLGMALVCVGIALLAGALWVLVPLLAAVAVIDRGVIAREERYLERKFGSAYTDYKTQTRRWL